MLETQSIDVTQMPTVFDSLSSYGHEQVVFCHDKSIGLRAIIAIHDTSLGPAFGGCRLYPYAQFHDALEDVLRLSRGMTYKSALAGLNLGGGKAIIIADPDKDKTELLLRRFGKFVDTLQGRYWTAEDVNISTKDIEYVHMETPYTVGLPEAMGGSGDPSPMTAYGVFIAMQVAVKRVFGAKEQLSNKTVLIQGAAGHVGQHLTSRLVEAKANVMVSDVSENKLADLCKKYPSIKVVPARDVYSTKMDIFAPCAMGGILNDEHIPKLDCAVIAGAANNQLQDERKHGRMLQKREILYVPDFMINAGGIINVYYEYQQRYNRDVSLKHIEQTHQTITKVLDYAEQHRLTTQEAAIRMAEQRIADIRQLPHNP